MRQLGRAIIGPGGDGNTTCLRQLDRMEAARYDLLGLACCVLGDPPLCAKLRHPIERRDRWHEYLTLTGEVFL